MRQLPFWQVPPPLHDVPVSLTQAPFSQCRQTPQLGPVSLTHMPFSQWRQAPHVVPAGFGLHFPFRHCLQMLHFFFLHDLAEDAGESAKIHSPPRLRPARARRMPRREG